DGFESQWARFRRDPEGARALIRAGESTPNPRLDPGELAAYTAMAQLILNLDETITRDGQARDPVAEQLQHLTRRHFCGKASAGLGTIAQASLLKRDLWAADADPNRSGAGVEGFPNFRPRAKRVIYLFQSGAPSQMDLFDEKPLLARLQGT